MHPNEEWIGWLWNNSQRVTVHSNLQENNLMSWKNRFKKVSVNNAVRSYSFLSLDRKTFIHLAFVWEVWHRFKDHFNAKDASVFFSQFLQLRVFQEKVKNQFEKSPIHPSKMIIFFLSFIEDEWLATDSTCWQIKTSKVHKAIHTRKTFEVLCNSTSRHERKTIASNFSIYFSR